MRLLDRYVLRYFLQAYFYCIAGFISIWFIFDISDNISTFLEERISRALIVKYYLTQVPQILVMLLPVALLLALLFVLGRMSRSNEVVSMLTAGVSVPRIIAPLLAAGLLTTAASTALNYSLAPHAEYARKTLLEDPKSRRQQLGQIVHGHRSPRNGDGFRLHARVVDVAGRQQRRPYAVPGVFLAGYAVVWTAFALVAFLGDTQIHLLVGNISSAEQSGMGLGADGFLASLNVGFILYVAGHIGIYLLDV